MRGNKGSFSDAARKFEDLDRDHPYAPEARRAIVISAYAFYKGGKLPEAIASAQRYTTMHPGTKEAALAHHIIASSYFDDMNGPNRDQAATRKDFARLGIDASASSVEAATALIYLESRKWATIVARTGATWD